MTLIQAHSKNAKKQIDKIIDSVESGKFSSNIISIAQVGSTANTLGKTPKYEDNPSSDIDLIFISNKYSPNIERYVSSFRDGKIEVWLKSYKQYLDPEIYFKSGYPAGDASKQDGWDLLAPKTGLNIEVFSGNTLYGKPVLENIRKNPPENISYIPTEEGFELATVALRDLFRGLHGRTMTSGINHLEKIGIRKNEGKKSLETILQNPNKTRLKNSEKAARDYILSKDNEIAKSLLRLGMSIYHEATNQFISKDPHKIYEKTRDEVNTVFLKKPDLKIWRDLLNTAYKIKVNDKKNLKFWDWDWNNISSKKNKYLVDLVSGFFREVSVISEELAEPYAWTQNTTKRISNHSSRRIPGIIDKINNLGSKEKETLDSAIDLYLNEMTKILSNRIIPPKFDEKLNLLSKNKEDTLKVLEVAVNKLKLPQDYQKNHKSQLLSLSQMQLLLAQNNKPEYFFEAKKSIDLALKETEENTFSKLLPDRKPWNNQKEAEAKLTLGEILIGLNNQKEGIKNIKESLKLDPRNSYAWSVLGEITNSETYSQISKTLRNPSELLALRPILGKDFKIVEKEVYSPWKTLISNQIDKNFEQVSNVGVDILQKELTLMNKIFLGEKDSGIIKEHLNVLETEEKRVKENLINLKTLKNSLNKISGENYPELEKNVNKLKRELLFKTNRNLEVNSLTNLSLNLLKEINSQRKNTKKYFLNKSKLNKEATLMELKQEFSQNKMSSKKYKELISKITKNYQIDNNKRIEL